MRNIGKIFEDEFKKSVNKEYFYYRFKDGTAAFNKDSNTRFQAKNICDCQVMTRDKLYLIELKNTKGTSLPLANIKANQVDGLSNIEHSRIHCYFIICFRDKEQCYAIEANYIKRFIELEERKSIPLSWCKDNGINIPMTRKKVRYKYDLEVLFGEE